MTDLVTLNELKTYKSITTFEQDNAYKALITQVSQLVKTYCNRTFIDNYASDLTQKFDAVNNSSVFIDEFPINSVTSVSTTVDGGATLLALVEDTDYFVGNDIGEITTGTGSNFLYYATIPYNSLIVTYSGGFQDTPDDLKLVVLDLVYYYFTQSFNPNKRLQSASLDTVSFSKLGDTAFPPHIKRVLDLYRSIRV